MTSRRTQWPVVQLSEVCEIIKGGVDPQRASSSTFAHYSLPAFDSGVGPQIELGAEIKSQKTIIENGVVLVSKLNPRIPRVWLIDDKQEHQRICSTEFVPLRCNPMQLDKLFLAFGLRYCLTTGEITGSTSAATKSRERAKPNDFLRLRIPAPPLKEQRRIVDILSRAESIVRLRREAQNKAEEIIPALFLDMFGDPATNPKGWPTARLGDLAEKMSDGPFGSNLKTSHYTENGVRVIRLQNIGIGYLNDNDRAFVSHEHFASLPRHRCLPGDVIIATLGDPNLRAFVLPSFIPEALNKADCVQFRCQRGTVEPEYICWLMNMPTTLIMAASLVQGITRTRISMGRLRELYVPVPDLDIQRNFVERVELLRSVESQQVLATEKAETSFEAILANMFSK